MGGFTPISALAIPDSALNLIFASFYGWYTEPSDDLWLSAHKNLTATISGSNGNEYTQHGFGLDSTISVLGCVEQYQFCNSNTKFPSSTPFRAAGQMSTSDLENINLNTYQTALATSLMWATKITSVNFLIQFLPSPLLAESLAQDTTSMPLAPNQWILEAQNWFTIGLSTMQHLLVDYITGPAPQYQQYVDKASNQNNTAIQWLCKNQIIERDDYTNFSTLAISLVFALGGIVIIVSASLETVVGLIRLRWRTGRWRQRAWWAEGTLQLQRRAFEGMGIKGWEVGEWSRVPLAPEGREFSGLRNWDEMLPLAGEKTVGIVRQITSSTGGFDKGNLVKMASITATSDEGTDEIGTVRSNSV